MSVFRGMIEVLIREKPGNWQSRRYSFEFQTGENGAVRDSLKRVVLNQTPPLRNKIGISTDNRDDHETFICFYSVKSWRSLSPMTRDTKVKKGFLTVVAPPRLPSAPFSPAPGKLSGCWSEPGDPHGLENDEGTSCWTVQTSHTHTCAHIKYITVTSWHYYESRLEDDQECVDLVFAAPYWYFQVLSYGHAKTRRGNASRRWSKTRKTNLSFQ